MKHLTIVASLLFSLSAQAAGHSLKSKEHSTERSGIKLALYERWLVGEEGKWKGNGKVILLVHGGTWSSRCTFDAVPGYSMMDTLAEDGWDVWAVDLHGYGGSAQSEHDWTEATSAAPDLDTAIDYIRAFRWVDKVSVFGFQWGSQVAGLFANLKPNKVAKLVMFGMRYQLSEPSAAPSVPWRANSNAQAMLKPSDGDLDQAMVHKRAEVCSLADTRSPNGALKDLGHPSQVDPAKITVPLLVLSSERDGDDKALADRLEFFKAAVSKNKWFVLLQGLGKYAPLEKGRARFEKSLLGFLDTP